MGLRIGIALGSGSARGWAHIGVLRALAELDIHPDIVCGSSIGAAVGAAYAAGRLDALEDWAHDIGWRQILGFVSLRAGALFEGDKLIEAFGERVPEVPIEALPRRFACVATDLYDGREVWFQSGSLHAAVRASIAIPGLLPPIEVDGRWLVDGGVVNPVPVSLCRALGADVVIAVNLHGGVVRHHAEHSVRPSVERGAKPERFGVLGSKLQALLGSADAAPGRFEVVVGTMNILQDRLTRMRMAGDPPDVQLSPRLAHIPLLDYTHAEEAIAIGRGAVELHRSAILAALGRDGGEYEMDGR